MTANVRAAIVVVDTSRYAKIAPGNLYDTGAWNSFNETRTFTTGL